MAGKKASGSGENSKKAAGNARKADAAAQKAANEEAKRAQADDEQWSKGAKSSAKKDVAEAKKAEAARKKAEKDALLAEEEKSLKAAKPSAAKGASTKKNPTAAASRGTLDQAMARLDADDDDDNTTSTKPSAPLNASGIDNALDALSLTGSSSNADKIDRHPERRFKAAYAAYEARRLPEMEAEGMGKGLRRNQRIELVKKEFEKSPENPFNQVNARFDSSKEEVRELREGERRRVEERLVGSG
ncbi:MAG: hypothetical protein M1816_007888 [Peltula sp. TS41687]|nr:MAG: hypothetical protein M1816_007888 [Peltula sp. TS41687]